MFIHLYSVNRHDAYEYYCAKCHPMDPCEFKAEGRTKTKGMCVRVEDFHQGKFSVWFFCCQCKKDFNTLPDDELYEG